MSSEPLVGIATPVYNGGEYLAECIESVLSQSHKNFVYVIVDNASTDSTPEVAARFAMQDSRVRHLRFEEFVSATDNHNRAFAAIDPAAEFCKIVQADDWISPDCVRQMVAAAQISPTIGLVSAYRIWGEEVDLVGVPEDVTFLTGHQILRQSLLGGPYVTGAPTALLFRTRFVQERGRFFLKGYMHDDTEAAYWMLSRHDFGFVHEVLTFARRQPGARLEWAERHGTAFPENIRFVLKYGHEVLDPSEYRARLRATLRKYLWFHMRQFPKPAGRLGPAFYAVHRAELEAIRGEGKSDPAVRRAMALVRLLLLRRLLGRRGRTPFETGIFQDDSPNVTRSPT